MAESTAVANLINAGIGGLVIVVVFLFLKFLTSERDKSDMQHERMMVFIKEQRTSNNDANAKAASLIAEAQVKAAELSSGTYVQVADAMKSLTVEIRLLKDCHIVHDTAMTVALASMVKARAAAAKKKGTVT